jgi:hypothetical protein
MKHVKLQSRPRYACIEKAPELIVVYVKFCKKGRADVRSTWGCC